MKTAVALSGGIDSSVALAILAGEGEDLFGISMCHLSPALANSGPRSCCSREALAEAKRLSDSFGIDHHLVRLRSEFERDVVIPAAMEYAAGKTPNPCVICNERIKFGLLFDRARELGADRFATGHYLRIALQGGRRLLRAARDPENDQSYFLYRLYSIPGILKKVLFPLGDLTKEEVREIGRSEGIVSSDRRSSAGACFIPDDDGMRRFLSVHAPEALEEGEIVTPDGTVVGRHGGIGLATIGQRRGLSLSLGKKAYCLDIDPETKRIVVGDDEDLYENEFTVRDLVLAPGASPPFECMVRIRFRHPAVSCRFDGSKVLLDEPERAITPGQAAVFHDDEGIVLGGGVIGTPSSTR